MSEQNAVEAMKPLPEYMQPGSYGPICTALNAFLAAFQTYGSPQEYVRDFVADNIYGENAASVMRHYQESNDLEVDGGCGPETRTELRDDDFDINVIALGVGGTTVFVQPDGQKIAWSPETGAVPVGPDPNQSALDLADSEAMHSGIQQQIEGSYTPTAGTYPSGC